MRSATSRCLVSLICASLGLLATGCASVLNGTHQDVRILTIPPGATAEALNQSTTTPGTLRLPRGEKQITVHITKDRFKSRDVVLLRERSGAVWANWALLPVGIHLGFEAGGGNLFADWAWHGFAGGVLLTALGFVSDSVSGAAYKFREEVVVGLDPLSTAERATADALERGEVQANDTRTQCPPSRRPPI